MTKIDRNKKELVPPDGGWGWIVSFAYALNNVIVLPLISGFGLIFQETFATLGITGTQASVIINMNHAFGMVLSLFIGPLLKRFGYRKVAVTGALWVAAGILLTSYAESFIHFLITYSLMTSIGIALTMSSFSLAINSYFRKNRGKAMALGMSITGFGPIIMPQVINSLIGALGIPGAVLVLGALSLHSLVAALLLRPIKWYMKSAEEDVDPEKDAEEEDDPSKSIEMQDMSKTSEQMSENEDDYLDNKKKLGISTRSLDQSNENGISKIEKKTISNPDIRNKHNTNEIKPIRWWETSTSEINLGSSVDIFSEKNRKYSTDISVGSRRSSAIHQREGSITENKTLLTIKENNDSKKIDEKTKETQQSLGIKIVKFFDLELLKDKIFVNIMIGISLAACVEINFAMLTPFILKDRNFNTSQIATIMSVIAGSDILFRFLSPFISKWCNKSARVMYIFSLCLLILTRSSLFLAKSFEAMIGVALGLGVAKGLRSVYMNLIIPNHVPIERLPFATGIQMVTNGFILMTIGTLLGVIRDRSGSYNISIIVINIVTFITVLMWTAEFLYLRYILKRQNTDT